MAMKVVDLEQRSEAWHEWRKTGVSASEAAIVMKRSKDKTPWRLWAEKVGLAEPEDLSLNPYVQYGIANEDLARQAFEARFPGEFAIPACAVSVKYPWMKASFDGLISGNRPVEFKCPADSTFEDVRANGTKSEFYQLYWCQVQHQMCVSGAKEGYLVFWKYREEPLIFRIERDDAFIFDLVKECEAFAKNVDKRKAPEKDPERDFFVPTGRLAAAWVTASELVKECDERLSSLEEKKERIEMSRKNALLELQTLMGGFYNAEYNGVRVTRYTQAGKVNYNQLLKEKAPNITSEDVDAYRGKPTTRYRTTVTETETGLPKNFVDPKAQTELRQLKQTADAPLFF